MALCHCSECLDTAELNLFRALKATIFGLVDTEEMVTDCILAMFLHYLPDMAKLEFEVGKLQLMNRFRTMKETL